MNYYKRTADALLQDLLDAFGAVLEKPLNFDPFGHARFAHLFVLYD